MNARFSLFFFFNLFTHHCYLRLRRQEIYNKNSLSSYIKMEIFFNKTTFAIDRIIFFLFTCANFDFAHSNTCAKSKFAHVNRKNSVRYSCARRSSRTRFARTGTTYFAHSYRNVLFSLLTSQSNSDK